MRNEASRGIIIDSFPILVAAVFLWRFHQNLTSPSKEATKRIETAAQIEIRKQSLLIISNGHIHISWY